MKLKTFCITWTKKYGKLKTITIIPGVDLNDAIKNLRDSKGKNIIIHEIL